MSGAPTQRIQLQRLDSTRRTEQVAVGRPLCRQMVRRAGLVRFARACDLGGRDAGPALQLAFVQCRLALPEPVAADPTELARVVCRRRQHVLGAWHDELPIHLPDPGNRFELRGLESGAAKRLAICKVIAQLENMLTLHRRGERNDQLARATRIPGRFGSVDLDRHRAEVGPLRQRERQARFAGGETEYGPIHPLRVGQPGLNPAAMDRRRVFDRPLLRAYRQRHV